MPVPSLDDPRLIRLLTLFGNLEPRLIKVLVPDKRFLLGYCWYNAYAQATTGGSVVYGWLLWDDGLGILAQHHAVWRKPDGELIDVTPNSEDATYTVFAEAAKNPFDYENLKTWISMRCRSQNDQTLDAVNREGNFLDNIHNKPVRARLNPNIEELNLIRKLCPHAGCNLELG